MTTTAPRLLGKVALVTGGSRGLGQALVRCLTKHGAKVAFSYARQAEAARELEKLVESQGGQAKAFEASVLDTKATEAMIKETERVLGPIDILVNNAAITQNLPLALLEEEDWDHVMDTNVKGTFLTTKSVLRGMIRRKKGVVLNIGSLVGVRMLEAPIHYTTSKAALMGFTMALAKEVARHNIRVLCLAPGLLEGGVGVNLPDYKLTDYLKHCSLGRVGGFDEVAELAAFMVSDANSYMTGETLVFDGGV